MQNKHKINNLPCNCVTKKSEFVWGGLAWNSALHWYKELIFWLERWQTAALRCGDKQEQDKAVGLTVPLTWQLSTIMGYMISAGHWEMSGGVGRSSKSGREIQGSNPVITLPPLPTSLLKKAPVRHREWTHRLLCLHTFIGWRGGTIYWISLPVHVLLFIVNTLTPPIPPHSPGVCFNGSGQHVGRRRQPSALLNPLIRWPELAKSNLGEAARGQGRGAGGTALSGSTRGHASVCHWTANPMSETGPKWI